MKEFLSLDKIKMITQEGAFGSFNFSSASTGFLLSKGEYSVYCNHIQGGAGVFVSNVWLNNNRISCPKLSEK